MVIKKTISEAQLNSELIKLFESGNTDKGKCKEELGILYKFRLQRFYKAYADAYSEWRKTREIAQNEQIQANATNSLKMAYMGKIERLQYLDKIAKGKVRVRVPFVINGEITEYEAEPTTKDRISAIAEMNKMEGDYAPAKTQNVDENGNVITNTQPIIIFNQSNNCDPIKEGDNN